MARGNPKSLAKNDVSRLLKPADVAAQRKDNFQ
jgi:hypothetical protein